MKVSNPENESLSGKARTQEEVNEEMNRALAEEVHIDYVDFDCYFIQIASAVPEREVEMFDRVDEVVEMYKKETSTEDAIKQIKKW